MDAPTGSSDMTTGLDITIKFKESGPFFERRDSIMNSAIKDTVQNIVEVGEQRLSRLLQPGGAMGQFKSIEQAGKQASTGNYRRNVHGEVRSYFFMRQQSFGRIHDSGVVYGPWLEGTSRRNNTTRFKGYRSFRNTKSWLDRTQTPKILQKHMSRMRRRMNGDIV
jgi:hypothetical protein